MKTLKKILFIGILGLGMALSSQVHAGEAIGLLNPLAGFTASPSADPVVFIQGRLAGLLAVMMGLIAILSIFPIIIGGLKLIASGGNPDMVQQGKKTLSWGVIGLVLGLSGIAVYYFFLNLLLPS